MFGQKQQSSVSFGGKTGLFRPTSAKTIMSGRQRIATIPTSTGRGDTGGGDNVQGNTHNAVANAQRDGQVRDMRSQNMLKRDAPGKTLESKKKNKVT